ncbi:MAG: ester cyclase [Acidobacteria bacterium]|nr:ester cyclase [Acidobacteriota bacterium]
MRFRPLLPTLALVSAVTALALGPSTLSAPKSDAAHNKDVALALMAKLSVGDLTGIEALVDEEGDFTPKNARSMQQLRRTYFPDMRYEVEEVVAEGDKVFLWYKVTGHHTGGDAKIPATGNILEIPEVALLTFHDGKVRDRRLLTDMRTLQKVMGDPEAEHSHDEK